MKKTIVALLVLSLLLSMTFISGCGGTSQNTIKTQSASDITDASVDNEMNAVVVAEDSGMEFGEVI